LGLVRAGEPHAVLLAKDWSSYEPRARFEELCRPLRDHFDVEGGVNVTVVYRQSEREILIRTFERGVKRATESCGTGAIAACAVLGRADRTQRVVSPGGEHKVDCDYRGIWSITATPRRNGRSTLARLIGTEEIESAFDRAGRRTDPYAHEEHAG
jgi:diaminopimelate epimerase